ncbi:YihY/virulence factor BrkB family protein [Streptomyces sp. NPDC058308]|uniref:YihY/virulence factor BrkB family protein n=1 Tax=Streptomyces sp. NPDC058308 TaxID=3346440 RepID=UPI0036E2BD97
MDWLKKLPGIGPLVEKGMRTHAWQAYERLDQVHWARLAAAMTFISFLALFPLLTVAAAIAAATLSKKQQNTLEDKISEQVPGISDQLNLDALVANAGTVGLVAGALLLFTGIGWVGSIRECLRAVWELEDEEENPVLRKVKDAGVLIGLGGVGLASFAASALASTAVGWAADLIGIDEKGWGTVLLQIIAFAIAVAADFLLLLYILTLLPGVQPRRRDLITAGLIGAAGFELLKLLLGGYMKGVASKSMYGAFGVPVALLLWISFTAKLMLFCAAWTATRKASGPGEEAVEEHPGDGEEAVSEETASTTAPSVEGGSTNASSEEGARRVR